MWVKPKLSGGLGLRYPEVLSEIFGAKLWWRWVAGGNEVQTALAQYTAYPVSGTWVPRILWFACVGLAGVKIDVFGMEV